jgi:hypothetical protein
MPAPRGRPRQPSFHAATVLMSVSAVDFDRAPHISPKPARRRYITNNPPGHTQLAINAQKGYKKIFLGLRWVFYCFEHGFVFY